MAASLQSYQFPYLYWPVYKLAMLGVSGVTAGVVLSSLHLITVPPVWMVSKALIPGKDLLAIALRAAAVALAFMSAVPLKTLEATGNDLLAAAPMLWAIAIAFQALAAKQSVSDRSHTRAAILSGLVGSLSPPNSATAHWSHYCPVYSCLFRERLRSASSGPCSTAQR